LTMMRRGRSVWLLWVTVLFLALWLVAVSCSAEAATRTTTPSTESLTVSPEPPGPVPSQYQTAYDALQSQLTSFASSAQAKYPERSSTTFGSELLTANGNAGTDLLSSSAIARVESELDAFSSLGVTGVTVDVAFPLLLSTTPNSSEYLSFYEQVARQVQARHMVLSVEENPLFVGTPLTKLAISFSGLTIGRYASEQRQQAQLIIDKLHPRYLTLLAEPDTYSANLHLDLNSPTSAVQVVRTELTGLHRGNTRVGAGSGSWLSPSIDQALVRQTNIDYLDVHVYTIGATSLADLVADVSAARAAHKFLVMDETWLDKPTNGAFGPQGAAHQLQLKSYSFWEPLDEQFVSAMVNEVRDEGFQYVSFYDGARAFFGYLTWTPQLDSASYQMASSQYNQLINVNMEHGVISPTGLRFRDSVNDESGH
jgi:hypothetical protein